MLYRHYKGWIYPPSSLLECFMPEQAFAAVNPSTFNKGTSRTTFVGVSYGLLQVQGKLGGDVCDFMCIHILCFQNVEFF